MKPLEFSKLPTALSPKKIGELFRIARSNLALSLRDLASLSRVSPAQILRIENGDAEYSLQVFHRLCGVLGIPPQEAIDWGTIEHLTIHVPRIENEREVQELLQTVADSESGRTFVSRVQLFAEIETRRIAWLLSMPYSDFGRMLTLESVLGKSALDQARQIFIGALWNMHNQERALALASLHQDPLRKLRALGMFNVSVLERLKTTEPERFTVESELNNTIHKTYGLAQYGKEDRQELVDNSESQELTIATPNFESDRMSFEELIQKLALLTSKRGRKTALAREFLVSRQAVDNWLAGKSRPKSETLLRLLDWVQAEESKQTKSPASVRAPAEQRTRSRKSKHEKPKPSPS